MANNTPITQLTEVELYGVIGDAVVAGINGSDVIWRMVEALETIASQLDDQKDLPRATAWQQVRRHWRKDNRG